MADTRARAIGDTQHLLDTLDSLIIHLRDTRTRYRSVVRSLQQGKPVEECLAAVDAAQTRKSMTAVLEEFELARHDSRMALIAAGVDEGMSINRLAKAWGISRQLASRYVNQLRNTSTH